MVVGRRLRSDDVGCSIRPSTSPQRRLGPQAVLVPRYNREIPAFAGMTFGSTRLNGAFGPIHIVTPDQVQGDGKLGVSIQNDGNCVGDARMPIRRYRRPTAGSMTPPVVRGASNVIGSCPSAG